MKLLRALVSITQKTLPFHRIFAYMLLSLAGQNAEAGTVNFFGPEKFLRNTGKPTSITRTFIVSNTNKTFTLLFQNGEGKRGHLSSAQLILNGTLIVGPNELNKQTEFITKPVELRRTNELLLVLMSEPGSSVEISIAGEADPPTSPITGLTVNPDGLFVNEPQPVVIRAQIPYDVTQPPPTVILRRVETNGSILNTEGPMTDDGNLANADEIAGDGLFSIRKTFVSDVSQPIILQISVQQGNQVLLSDTFSLAVFTHLTQSQVTDSLVIQGNALQNLQTLLGTTDLKTATSLVLAQLRNTPGVVRAEISGSGNGIWLEHSSGIWGTLLIIPDGSQGGIKLSGGNSSALSQAAATPADMLIKSKKALVLSPFHSQLSSSDMASSVADVIKSSSCPKFDVTYLENSAVTVNSMKNLSQYGLVVINTHGGTFDTDNKIDVATREPVNAATAMTHELDVKQQRIISVSVCKLDLPLLGCVFSETIWAITPAFVRNYAGKYPDSLVVMGACDSAFNNMMADAFTQNGAKAYLGYSATVLSTFVKSSATDFFKKFLEDPLVTTVGQAFTTGQHDSSTPPASFLLLGGNAAQSLEKPSAGISDGSFELGNLGAWKAVGDGRVVSQLGQFAPTDGAYMAVISTGLGFTTSSGSIEQEICLPAGTKTIEFSWNFNSEEFVEYCGSGFQDFFRVDIVTDSGTQNIFSKRVDDLCSSVSPSNLKFDQSSGNCVSTPGVGVGTGGNDCLVWSTGWQNQSIDISAIATANQEKSVKIKVSAGDVGDSIYDTAVLLDNIRVSP